MTRQKNSAGMDRPELPLLQMVNLLVLLFAPAALAVVIAKPPPSQSLAATPPPSLSSIQPSRPLVADSQRVSRPAAARSRNASASALAGPAGPSLAAAGQPAAGDKGLKIDLLSRVDPDADQLEPGWQRVGQTLRAGRGTAALELPYRPPQEYDFEIEFSKPNGAVAQLLYKKERSFHWEMSNVRYGLERINNKILDVNASAVRSDVVTSNDRHVSLVQIRDGEIRTFLDGKPLLTWRTGYSEFSPNVLRRDPTRLGLRTWKCPATFFRIEVTEITGKGTLLR